ncbi:MAG: ABC transporter permease [Acidobacteriaceae bacterium]|jgi:ABC-type transport system involved in multi-copper enzyme maturation permease subunit
MAMFWEFFSFEIRFRLKSISTYMYFLLWFAFSFFCVASESFGPVGSSNGKVLLNGPFANSIDDFFSCLFGIIVIAAIFGTSILRDFQRDTYQLLFTKPISKFAYLGGRWAGSFVTTVFAFSGMIFGTWIGTFAPWTDHTRIAPNHLWWYLQPFLSITVVQIFFAGSLFFAVAALTRKIFIVYLQGVALFMLYLIGITVFSATRSLEHFWSGILDPVGLQLFDDITRYWTVVEKNTLLLPWDFSGYSPGVFLFNRLLWIAVGFASLASAGWFFPMSVEALTARAQGRRAARSRLQEAEEARPVRSLVAARLPRVHQVFGPRTTLTQYLSLSGLRIRTILREIPFWAIVGLLTVFAVNNGYYAGHFGDENVWPVTYLMLQSVEGGAMLFFYIVATLYAAELVWRERDNRFDGIHDALPIHEATDWLSKLTAIAFVELALLTLTMLAGILMQTIAGYHHYELLEYFKELYVVTFPQVLGFAILAMFVQTAVPNKFVGHGIVIGIFVLTPILFSFGWENTLYLPGAIPPYTYSDMNGYGHFVPALFWSITYWSAVFCLLGVISIAYTRRGAEESLAARTRLALRQAPRLIPAAALFLLIAIGSGAWYFLNAHVLNEYLNAKARRDIQTAYERDFKKYENLPQPKVTAVDATVNIYPDRRSFDGALRMTLQNKSSVPIPQIHITDEQQSVTNLQFDRPFHLVSRSPRDLYSIYAFDQPLAPGEFVTLTCNIGHQTRGFRDGNEPAEFAYNGTFFDSGYTPYIGYNSGFELDDPRRRREEHLPPLEEMAHRGDPDHSLDNIFPRDSDWITYHTVVSTIPGQIAIAPGYLQREWQKDGRRFFEYSMGSTHILDFYAYLSARYSVRKEVYNGPGGPVNLEVYYYPTHTYDIDDMLASSKAGLDLYQRIYSPYQFTQYRIMEFPRYRGFAQSFPNTVPYSEGIGFIGRMLKPTDVDLTYFVTAHELGHQWWAHQLIGADVEGSNMMSETLAQYSAYIVMEHKYGKDYMHRVLRHFLDRYLRGRGGETRHEPPLALVQREPYVWYEKGGQIMYTLADYIGEDRVDLALHNFLMQYRYANANNQVDAVDSAHGAGAMDHPYPDTRMLVDALRAQTPPELQYLIDDGFNRIVLYDNKTISATSEKTPDGKYKVTLVVQARKVQADGNGVESPMPMNDYIDIGVFTGKKDEEKPLYMKKEQFTEGARTFTIVVDQQPTRAGIDPYNKLIDRIADDNMIDITRK